MTALSSISGNHGFGQFAAARVRIRTDSSLLRSGGRASASGRASYKELRGLQRLKDALQLLRPDRLRLSRSSDGTGTSSVYASAVSNSAIDFSANLRSTEQINTAPTSYSAFQPTFIGSYATVPWDGNATSTAVASVGGNYDGSNGTGTLTFRVTRAGTHGVDDVTLKALDSNGVVLDTLEIKKENPLNQVYTLSNGLQIVLGAGAVVKDEEFSVDVSLNNTFFTPNSPAWTGSTAQATIGGTYLGLNGSGQLTFKVAKQGTHGIHDLELDVFDPNQNFIETLKIDKEHAIGQQYTLLNGLTLTLSAGDLVLGETFGVTVEAGVPSATGPAEPDWVTGSAGATVSGTYDGSLGVGTMTFVADDTGTHGVDDLKIKAYGPDGVFIQDIDVKKEHPLNSQYGLSNGLLVTFSAGGMIKGEKFTVDLLTVTEFTTDPNPVISTSTITMGGVYDGSLGSGTMTLQIAQGGVHGTDDLAIDVFDPNGAFLETVTIAASDPLNQSYVLSTGLSFQVGAGSLEEGETFTVDVDHLTPSAVNPDNAFNETGNDRPNFDDGLMVTAGSFEVNGVTITVNANDSINSVLARINELVPEVTARFNAATESIVFNGQPDDPDLVIEVSNDTSGFLTATKLIDAVAVPAGGSPGMSIDQAPILDSVSSGEFFVNGVGISLDITTDSIDDIVSRINSSDANATAEFDPETLLFSITANDLTDLDLDSNGTNFFEAMFISSGSYASTTAVTPNESSMSGPGRQSREQIRKAIEKIAWEFNEIFQNSNGLDGLRKKLQGAVAAGFGQDGVVFDSKYGLSFDFTGQTGSVLNFDRAQEKTLTSALRSANGTRALRKLLFGGESGNDGLAERLLSVVNVAERELSAELESGAYRNPRLGY